MALYLFLISISPLEDRYYTFIYISPIQASHAVASTSAIPYFNIHMQVEIDKSERNATTLDVKQVHMAIVNSIITIRGLRHKGC